MDDADTCTCPSCADPRLWRPKDGFVPHESVIGVVPQGRDWPRPGDTVLVDWEVGRASPAGVKGFDFYQRGATEIPVTGAFDPVSGHTVTYDWARWDAEFGTRPAADEDDRDTGKAHDLSPVQHDAAIYALSVIGFAVSLALLVTTANPLNGVGAMLSLLVIVLEAGS